MRKRESMKQRKLLRPRRRLRQLPRHRKSKRRKLRRKMTHGEILLLSRKKNPKLTIGAFPKSLKAKLKLDGVVRQHQSQRSNQKSSLPLKLKKPGEYLPRKRLRKNPKGGVLLSQHLRLNPLRRHSP